MTAGEYGLARRMWHQLEPVHAVFWYAPEVFAEAGRSLPDTAGIPDLHVSRAQPTRPVARA